MLLAIDLGNTNCSLAVMNGHKTLEHFLIASNNAVWEFQTLLTEEVKRINKKYPQLSDVILCSVVPKLNKDVRKVIQKELDVNFLVVGEDINVPIKNKYRNPKQVGMDRLVCAFAVSQLYGCPAIVIDLGTAITFDVISKKREYEGGLIVPGIQLSSESLFSKTALLPRVDKIEIPKNLIGKDTKESILSGLFNGYGAMCSGLIDMLAKRLSSRPKVIVTGGHLDIMKKYIAGQINHIDRNLVFRGLSLLHQVNSNKSNT